MTKKEKPKHERKRMKRFADEVEPWMTGQPSEKYPEIKKRKPK
jgi:hypothetical protein